MDVMEELVKHVSKTTFDDLPPEIVSITKRSFLDTLGAIIAGSRVEGCKILLDYVHDCAGPAESTIAVFGGKAPAPLAAQVNGAMARAYEIDDITDIFPLHPSASLIPACLAVAEREGKRNGKDLLTAVALGQDLIIRLSQSVKKSPIISGRYNLFKVFAFTAAAGKLMGLSEEQLLSAVGISYSQMVGDGQAQADGVMMSYIQQGTAAKSAIESALMARKGITGTRTVLQGQRGFYNGFEPDPNLEALTAGLGTVFKGIDLCIKLHSACRVTHQPIDLAQTFLAEGVTADKIDSIVVRVGDQPYSLVCQPLELKRRPTTMVDAQFSIPYLTAAAFVRGDVFLEEINQEFINDAKILELAQKISPVLDSRCNTDLAVGSVVMEVTTKDGNTLRKESRFPRGNPNNPATPEECMRKFRKCVGHSLKPFSDKQADELIEVIDNLEQVDRIEQVTNLLAPKGK